LIWGWSIVRESKKFGDEDIDGADARVEEFHTGARSIDEGISPFVWLMTMVDFDCCV